ncbi:hypothetical protein [Albimonas pacifica]|uniref:Uncharacterized protein n=1 Tax=Albimonas pacifica TaxID=1114924 RepID=A0A1I3BPC3_9RHOB|nr:hypothetical protein [Albimonas pacifica]SFH64112.1 hypothetical protein SAMN05216258_101239 [Albimonas pacifica]
MPDLPVRAAPQTRRGIEAEAARLAHVAVRPAPSGRTSRDAAPSPAALAHLPARAGRIAAAQRAAVVPDDGDASP